MFESHPIVVIFGAGATRGAFSSRQPPPPIDNDFFTIASQLHGHGTEKLAREVLKSVWELYGRTDSVGLEQYYRDIETRNVMRLFPTTPRKQKNWQKRLDELNELIRRVYIHTTCNMKQRVTPESSGIHHDILNALELNDTIITFNYDTVIEESFRTAEKWNPKYGYGVEISGSTANWCYGWMRTKSCLDANNSKTVLLKLHGSVNFDFVSGRLKLKARPYYVRPSKSRGWLSEKVSILPPGWNKQITKKPYSELWHKAKAALQKCKTLLVIGYSLPETDILAHALINEVVRTRSKSPVSSIKELHLADPDAKVKEKYMGLLKPIMDYKTRIFKYQNIQEMHRSIMRK